MIDLIKTNIKYVVFAMGFPLVLVGCNTMEGVGTDISHAGHALEHAAEDAKQPCTPPPASCPARTRTRAR